MTHLSRRTGLAIAVLVFACAIVLALHAEERETLTFCQFGPKVKVISPETKADGCSGTAKIQALQWECTAVDNVESKIIEFKRKLGAEAGEECRRHCQRRSSSCDGRLEGSAECGLETDREDAVVMGKRQGCREDCHGPAFAFCSLYDAGFRTDDEARIAKQKPNCRCFKRKS